MKIRDEDHLEKIEREIKFSDNWDTYGWGPSRKAAYKAVRGILRKATGRPWGEAHPEILTKIKTKFPKLSRVELDQIIENCVEFALKIIDGVPYEPAGPYWGSTGHAWRPAYSYSSWSSQFYLDGANIVRALPKAPKKPKKKKEITEIREGNILYRKENGIWFKYELDKVVNPYTFRERDPLIHLKKEKGWGTDTWTFFSKKQLNSKELSKKGLTNNPD